MKYFAFGDESGISATESCYSIGILSIPEDKIEKFNTYIEELKKKHGIIGELKWQKIKNSSGQANICIDLMNMILISSCCFSSIVVNKALYRKWKKDREEAFYTTYTFLLKHVAKETNTDLIVYIDQKSDKYPKQNEVVEIIANHMLAKIKHDRSIKQVKMFDSKLFNGLQVVDILTGAVNTGYMKYLEPEKKFSKAKEAALKKMSLMLGWDYLHYDTYPNKDLNIWHFPIECRANPATKEIVPNRNIRYYKRVEI